MPKLLTKQLAERTINKLKSCIEKAAKKGDKYAAERFAEDIEDIEAGIRHGLFPEEEG